MTSTSKAYCSVPQCRNYISKTISIHRFPPDENLKKKWQIALKIGKPISPHMYVCSEHFLSSDYLPRPTASLQRRRLKKGAIPSQKIPVTSHQCGSFVRTSRKRIVTEDVEEDTSVEAPPSVCAVMEVDSQIQTNFNPVSKKSSYGQRKNPLTHINLQEEKTFIDKGVQTEPYNFGFIDLLDTDAKLKSFTGIDHELLRDIENCSNNVLKYNKYEETKLKVKLMLVLIKIKLNLPFTCLAILFNLTDTTCTRYFYNFLPLLETALKPAVYWPTKEEILANLPKCFENFRATRIVLDCTEVFIQKPNCLICRIQTYSHYKHSHTTKWLIGITPSGLISYVSPGYGGRSSDKSIVVQEKLIAKCDPGDAIMVDKGFLIERECEDMFIKLIRPPFLRKKRQLSKEDSERTADIARARVHVERAIQRIKSFNILNDKINWYLTPVMDSVVIIIAALVNLSSSILGDDKF